MIKTNVFFDVTFRYGPVGGVPGTGYNPPALINTMISMALSPGYVKVRYP